jgi:hypothetical protein
MAPDGFRVVFGAGRAIVLAGVDAFAEDLAGALAVALTGAFVADGAALADLTGAFTEALVAAGFATLVTGFAGLRELAGVALTDLAGAFTEALVAAGFATLAGAFAGAFEAFAFTAAPFLTSAATLVVGAIGPSCRDEGD